MRSALRVVPVALALAALGAAGSGAAAEAAQDCPATNIPDSLVLEGGTPQWSKLASPYASPFEVGLANSNGCPVTTGLVGVPVTFSAPASGASGTFAASGSNSAIVGTNAAGVAAAPQFTANRTSGDYTVVATSQYGSLTFALHNTASGVAAAILAVSPSREAATVGSAYAQPLRATVLDPNGTPVAGASVTFSLGSATGGNGGAGSGAATAGASFDGGGAQATETTDATGTAVSPRLTANDVAGAFAASATTAGVVEPAAFSLRNVAGKPPTIRALSRGTQSALVDARYATPLQVRVLDGQRKPVQGASVTFTLGSAGGGGGGGAQAAAGAAFVGGTGQATQTTDADGVAVSPAFSANGTAGTFAATATTAGTSAAASFALDNLAARTATLRATGGARSASVGHRYAKPLRVDLRSANGNPLQGVTVTFTIGSGGAGGGASANAASATFAGGGGQATAVTDAAGVAASPQLTANTVAGTFTATATAGGADGTAAFSLRNRAGGAKAVAAGVAASESTVVATRFPVRLAVTVTDGNSNPVPGAFVTFSAPTVGPSGRFAGGAQIVRMRTDASGVAVAPPFVADRAAGGYVVRATVRGVARSAAFALVNEPAA
jgi:protocatechuate 3,4-dioxygenase beta subunit